MPTYVLLTTLTPDGRETLHKSPDRLTAVNAEIEALGCKLVAQYALLGLYAAASSHEATLPPPPTGQWFQLYRGGADGRLGGRIGAIAFFVEGGAGIAMISSNVLEKAMVTDPGEKYSITFHGGAGLEYQLENRHYAVGGGVDGFLVPQFATMKAIDSRLYLRYTYGGG